MTMRRTIGMTLGAVALGWVLIGTGGAAKHEEPTHPARALNSSHRAV